MKLAFDEKNHIYRVEGEEIPSVTTLLQKHGIVNTDWYDEQGKVRGTYVHKGAEFVDDGTIDWEELDPMLMPYLRGYEKFTKDFEHEIKYSEHREFDAEIWYAGTLDRVINYCGENILYDIKTGAVSPPWVYIQLAAYWNLFKRKIKIDSVAVLQLRGDASYTFIKIPMVKIIQGWKEFQAICLVDKLGKKYG